MYILTTHKNTSLNSKKSTYFHHIMEFCFFKDIILDRFVHTQKTNRFENKINT